MGCKKEIAHRVREGGGLYVLAVKGYQERLVADTQACFAAELEKGEVGGYSYHETVDRNHGRIESRQYFSRTVWDRLFGTLRPEY